MKTIFLLFAVAFLVFHVQGKANPEEAKDDAKSMEEGIYQRSTIVCRSVGGTCRKTCLHSEVSVGKCLPDVHCCQAF